MTLELVQGTDDWKQARVGKVTASRVADVVAKTKTGWGASRANYMAELLRERLTGRPVEQYRSKAMERGTQLEPVARDYYEITRGVDVVKVGFVPHPKIAMSGASPDGLVGDQGIIEIKCPEDAAHFETLETKKISSAYLKQIAWNFACNPDRLWCDYISYHPDMPPTMQFWPKTILRADVADLIDELEREVPIFLAELCKKVELFRREYNVELPVAA